MWNQDANSSDQAIRLESKPNAVLEYKDICVLERGRYVQLNLSYLHLNTSEYVALGDLSGVVNFLSVSDFLRMRSRLSN